MLPSGDTASATAGFYLAFWIGADIFAVPQERVQEVARQRPIIAAPWMPSCIHGVVQLRNAILPVVDLRRKFGVPNPISNHTANIVVVGLSNQTLPIKRIGLIVDRISGSTRFTTQQIEETPELKISAETAFVHGLARVNNTVKTILDIDWLLIRERYACEAHG